MVTGLEPVVEADGPVAAADEDATICAVGPPEADEGEQRRLGRDVDVIR